MKKSGRNRFLDHRLKKQVKTRWDTRFDMLQSVIENFDELKKNAALKVHINQINEELLKEFASLLGVVKKIRLELCSESKPTFNLVAISYGKMMKLMKLKVADSDPIKVFKQRFAKHLGIKYVVTDLHLIVTFLSPCYRSFVLPDRNIVASHLNKRITYLHCRNE